MPTYDFRCPNGHVFELFQRMSDPAPERCIVCGADPVERLLSPVAVHFKGSGFYATDYGRNARRDGSKDGDPTTETKRDEKPAAPGGEKAATSASSTES